MAKEPTELPRVYIRERMKEPRVTAKQLAEKMETSEAQISRLLSGKRKMTLEWLYAFARTLDVPIATLFQDPQSAETPIREKSEIFAFLNRIEGLADKDRVLLLDTIIKDIEFNTLRAHIQSGGLSEPETLRRVPAPSRRQ